MTSDTLLKIATEILAESIKYKTYYGNEYEEIVEYYADVLSRYGVSVTIHRVPDEYTRRHISPQCNPDKPRYILIARTGRGCRTLQFNGHYDVVPPGEGWSHDAFSPLIVDNRIYGRGASDMKGGIATLLATLIYYSQREPDIVLEAVLVPDEEIGGLTGTGYLVRELGSRPDWAVIAEPSGINNVWIGHRGNAWFLIRVYGIQAHGSTPWLGDNAFENMIKFAREFIDVYRAHLSMRESQYDYDDPRARIPSITPGGLLLSPGAVNIVPGEVGFSIDRRLVVEERLDQVIQEFNKIAEEISAKTGVKVKVELMSASNPAFTSPDSLLVKLIENSISRIIGTKPRLTICAGGLDLKYYSEHGLQAVAYGPGNPSLAHKQNEYIDLSDIKSVINVYIDLVKNLERHSHIEE